MSPLAIIGGIVAGIFDDWREKQQQKRRVREAVAKRREALAESKETHNQNWELAALEGKDVWLRRVSFACWSFPMVWAVFDPVGARHFFEVTMAALPEWYKWGYLAMTGGIWGVAEMKARGILK